MLRSLAVILGISTISVVNSATAQQVPVELSRLENRSYSEDEERFFPKISDNRGLDFSENVVGEISRERSEFDFLGENIVIETGDMDSNESFSNFETSMTGDRSDETQVLLQFYEW